MSDRGTRRSDSRGRDSRDGGGVAPRRGDRDGSRGRDSRGGGGGDRDRDRDRDRGRGASDEDRRQQQRPSSAGGGGGGPRQATPTKPPAGPGAFSGVSNLLKSAIEDARRRAAQESAGGAGGGDGGDSSPEEGEAPAPGEEEGGGGPKRRRHSPISWSSPKRWAGEAPEDGGRLQRRPAAAEGALSLRERMAAEAEEFRRLQAEVAAAGDVALKSSPSVSDASAEDLLGKGAAAEEAAAEGPAAAGGGGGGGGGARRMRWLDEEGEENGGGGGGGGKSGSRRGVRGSEAPEEGQAEGGDEDEIMRELNRREREDLDHGGGAASGSETPNGSDAGPGPAGAAGNGTPGRDALGTAGTAGAEVERELEGRPFEKSMLEECRSVDEYEKLNRISEGTYGVVFRAREKRTGRIYALKKIKLDAYNIGFPQTSIREINVLLSLHHPNIVNVSEVVVGGNGTSVFMVMEYVEHDVRQLLDKELKRNPLSTAQVKCLLRQLLAGMAYLHEHWVLHRDLKTSNLLYGNDGTLKICDFGLARQYGSPLKPYTPMVVTLWYRSIERLLGDETYSTPLDMWAVGCIMAEMLSGTPLFQGKGEMDQVKQIFAVLGTPNSEDWPGWDQLPYFKTFKVAPGKPSTLRQRFPRVNLGAGPMLSDAGFDLLSRLLTLNPAQRLSAREALEHEWFREGPLPAPKHIMPTFPPRGGGGD